MDIETIRKLIKKNEASHKKFVTEAETAERYYRNENDITRSHKRNQESSPLRNADNRIPRNFHKLLVNQKTAYMMTAPPLFDVGSKKVNEQITDILGDAYSKYCNNICVNAANCCVAWIHYWVSEDGKFKYAVMDSKQIIPVFSKSLDNELAAVLRNYSDISEDDGREIVVWEYWTESECHAFMHTKDTIPDTGLMPCSKFESIDEGVEMRTNVYRHDLEEVPFIPFYNNNILTNDLQDIKLLIDAYDKVFSGFLNDLEDIQEVIFVLTNYGGQDLGEFLKDLKDYKAIKLDSDGDGDKSGVQMLNIEIPIEARKEFLEITRKAIFEQGQGVDPNPEKFGSASGESLKFLYSLLELKAGFTETEFKLGFGRLVRAVCRHIGVECRQVMQTWTRTAVTNDKELAEISNSSIGNISRRSALRYHPYVDNVEDELKQIEKEQKEDESNNDIYQKAFKGQDGYDSKTGDIDVKEE